MYWSQDDPGRALEYNLQSLAIKEEIGHQWGIAISLNNIGLIYKDLGRLEEAKESHERGLAIY